MNKTFKALTLAVLAAFSPLAQPVDMQQLFDDINANGNYSGPAVVSGQTQNIITGGSLFMRVPKRTYNLTAMSAPRWSAGCGGIDIYAGSFSYINEEAFVNMMRNIGQNAMGYAFKLAIDNLCAPCGNILQALDATARAMNQFNIDSCKAAEGLVSAAESVVRDNDFKMTAQNFGIEGGDFSDAQEAWSKVWSDEGKAANQLKDAKSNPELADKTPTGNLVWKALKKLNGVSDQHRELLMSLTGTVIVDPDTLNQKAYPPAPIDIADIIGSFGTENMKAMRYQCANGLGKDECTLLTGPTLIDSGMPTFRTLVLQKLNLLMDKIANRSEYGVDQEDLIGFISVVDFPVYKMISVSTSFNNAAIADSLINKYADAIAARYAQVFINESVREMQAALAHYKTNSSTSDAQDIENKILPELKDVADKARQTVMQAEQRAVTGYNIALEIQSLERVMTSNMSQMLRNSMAFGKTIN
jgi:conjugative transfer pilus assembly protein TraH